MMHDEGDISNDGQARTVARAACLACRNAKRRCDGQQPVCGPCAGRGVEEGGCHFVTSKRGGPRYKGVKGADAARVKAERERQREELKWNKDKGRRERETSARIPPSVGAYERYEGNATGSQSGTSSSRDWNGGGNGDSQAVLASSSTSYPAAVNARAGNGTGLHNISSTAESQNHSVLTPSSLHLLNGEASNFATPGAFTNIGSVDAAYPTPDYQQQMAAASAAAAAAGSNPSLLFGQPEHALPNEFLNLGNGDLLSFSNLELLQRIQERTAVQQENNQFSDFFARLEVLPKAGIIAGCPIINPMDVMMDWEGGETGGNVQDNEIGVRMLLSDFYELVYPACPVLPSPGNLPSLAFYFSGKGPCGLFAALSAVVALHLPQDEAYKTLKASHHPLQRYETSPTNISSVSSSSQRTNEDVAAYHAKTSEFILYQYETKKRTCFMDPTAANPFDGMDEELITIEAGAAHTLLCLYYYGSGKPLGHQRAYKHAVEGWNLLQKLDLHSKSSWQASGAPEEKANATRPFATQIKLEWAKRVYWCSYTAATVMSCTGGFAPFGNPKDGVMDLQLRPSLEDVSAWSVMVRGAQQVSRCYRLLYDLDQLRSRLIERGNSMNAAEMQQVTAERQAIFNAMIKIDLEMSNYTRFDAGWRDPPPEPGDQGFKTADKELARSLKASGRLMTSGAIIILHRAQAFSNARVFMEPQCGIPEASRMTNEGGPAIDSIMHHAKTHELPLPRLGGLPSPPVADGNETEPRYLPPNGVWQPDDRKNDEAPQQYRQMPVHPFLTDRYSGGPFDAPHSLERCRFAASTMVGTLPRILQDPSRVPKLPPYSSCSYVLGAYAILMLTLLIQVRGEMAVNGLPTNEGNDVAKIVNPDELRMQLESHRAPVRDIILALRKFARVWSKAVDYENEVSTLLAANEILG